MARVELDRATAPEGGLFERADELAGLAERLAAVEATGMGHVVLLRGEAGVGKTALIREFCERRAGSTTIAGGACEPLFAPRPLGPFLEIAQSLDGELPALVEKGAMPYQVVAELAEELRGQGRAILLLEDVHWADEATLDAFRLLARRVQSVPALVVASYRDDQLDVRDPLQIVLGELATSPSISRMKLRGLSPAAVAELAEPYGADADELYLKTGGNPFFVVEALAAGADAIPETVRDAVLARAARLGPSGRSILEAVAVVPPQAELWLLEAIARESAEGLDECLGSGMLRSDPAGISFRHELARLAVEESVSPQRKLELNRAALAALSDPPRGPVDHARLAHHAEAAGDGEAVLRFAPAAAARAAALGAHREAAAQYARTLRFARDREPSERADLLHLRSIECYVTDDIDEAIEAGQEELELRRALGQRQEEGEALSWLSQILWCPGRTMESRRAREEAVALLETLPPGRQLATAWMDSWSVEHVTCALDLAVELGDTDVGIRALSILGHRGFAEGGRETIEQCIELAREDGLVELTGWIFSHASAAALGARQYEIVLELSDRAVDYCSERGLELYRAYALGYRARAELDQGRWDQAAETASTVLLTRRASILPRIFGLVVLGLVRARRGDPGHEELLEEAWALGEPTDELERMGPAAIARAEAAWLAGDRDAVLAVTEHPFRLALETGDLRAVGELGLWRRRTGSGDAVPAQAAEPYASQLAGDWASAAAFWDEAGCPYEGALARADSGDGEQLRRAFDELQRLGARPAAAIVAGRLRERGVRGLPRGPRPATRENPAGLTPRQLEVLELLAEGMRDSEIAARLVLSDRTVGHHVSAILRKLQARNRGQATAEALRLGLVSQDR
jgi:DNA-binding CsgD family transcriptional regulator/tetratricopeptide (TPR) repeat protein